MESEERERKSWTHSRPGTARGRGFICRSSAAGRIPRYFFMGRAGHPAERTSWRDILARGRLAQRWDIARGAAQSLLPRRAAIPALQGSGTCSRRGSARPQKRALRGGAHNKRMTSPRPVGWTISTAIGSGPFVDARPAWGPRPSGRGRLTTAIWHGRAGPRRSTGRPAALFPEGRRSAGCRLVLRHPGWFSDAVESPPSLLCPKGKGELYIAWPPEHGDPSGALADGQKPLRAHFRTRQASPGRRIELYTGSPHGFGLSRGARSTTKPAGRAPLG